MLCVVCTRPIPNFQDENKLCQSCASRIKLKGEFGDDMTIDDLESVQKQLWHDLNLGDDSDYEAELNYLMEAKKATILNKQKKCPAINPKDDMSEFPCNQYKGMKHDSKFELLANESPPKCCNEFKEKVEHKDAYDTFSNMRFGDTHSNQPNQKLPDLHSQPMKEKTNRRVAINNSAIISIVSVKKPHETSNPALNGTAATACRAVFRPTHKREPVPQFEKIHSVECQHDFITKSDVNPRHGYKNPFICPVTLCKNIIPVSDLIKHFKLNHIRVPIVRIDPDACTNLFWEVKVNQFGSSHCLMLLLTTGKFEEFGYGQFKNCLPVAIMTTKIKFSELADVKCERDDDGWFYLIWLTAMCSPEEPVHYTLSAWSDTDGKRVQIVNSGISYSIREDQKPKTVFQSGKAMVLTSEQVDKLSNSNRDMVKLQVVVH